ncbi:glycoside hydrolase family 26 protein [Bacillus sp. FJAT-27445]|uniref:glycoside hydrolase family 26 protein n=1 Tax=Bacillus sp. FJAT-27445 TaxID=1679166 RepID=UPI0007444BF1|nr:glycosyl hydrolase [Bacillus sp. FJAT-27445]
MKKLLIILLSLSVLGGGAYWFDSQPDKDRHVQVETKPAAGQPKKEKPYVEEFTGGDFYVLWKNEQKSKTLYPDNVSGLAVNETTATYKNNWNGYQFNFPKEWEVDRRQAPHFTRLFTKDFRIDLTVQNVDKAWTSPQGYIAKTIETLKPNITADRSWWQQGFAARQIDYSRPIITGIDHDMNQYSYLFLTRGNRVFTFQLKTDQQNFEAMKTQLKEVASTLKIYSPIQMDLNTAIKANPPNPEIRLKHKKDSLIIPKNHFVMGAYLPKTRDIDGLNGYLQNPLGAQMFYKPIDSGYDEYTEELLQNDRLPIVTLLYEKANSKANADVTEGILNGSFDQNLLTWAKAVKKLHGPVLFRVGNEMNGSWTDWSHKNTYNDPDLYKLTFRHIVELFKKNGTNNAYFVWNPNHVSSPYFEWNEAHMYYPGDNFVDFVGMTSYNFGKTQWNNYQSVKTLYDDLYWEYSRSYYGKPLMIGEFGAVETGGNRAEWIKSAFEAIPRSYPNIKIAVWFDQAHGEFDFRIRTTPASAEAFKNGMAQPAVVKGLNYKEQ